MAESRFIYDRYPVPASTPSVHPVWYAYAKDAMLRGVSQVPALDARSGSIQVSMRVQACAEMRGYAEVHMCGHQPRLTENDHQSNVNRASACGARSARAQCVARAVYATLQAARAARCRTAGDWWSLELNPGGRSGTSRMRPGASGTRRLAHYERSNAHWCPGGVRVRLCVTSVQACWPYCRTTAHDSDTHTVCQR
jgi:hypothetical protein